MKMKNKSLIILAVVLLNVLAAAMIISSLISGNSKYNDAISLARKYSEQNLCSKAITQYEEVLKIKDTIEVRTEMILTYQKGLENGEFTNKYEIDNQVFAVIDAHRNDNKAYEYSAQFFFDTGDFEDCVTVLKQAEHQNVSSKKLKEITENVRYKYSLAYSMYSDVKPIFDGKYAVREGESYRYLDNKASSAVGSGYSFASSFSEKLAFVKKNGFTFIVNEAGERQAYFSETIASSSGVGSGLLACLEDEVYKYYDINGEYKFGEYKFAGRFRNNIAAVKVSEDEWYLINPEGKKIIETKFEDILLNEHDECAARGIIFAKTNGKYKMYNLDLKQVGSLECDDACLFVSEGYAAFAKDGKWGFVDEKGKIVIEPKFDDAKSFSSGLAGVKNGDMWSFIDTNGKIVIEGNFEDVDYMNDAGLCFVKTEGYWKYISLYYVK